MHPVGHGIGRRAAGAGRRAFVVAAFAAVLGGLSGIALGSWLSWRTVDPMAPGRAAALLGLLTSKRMRRHGPALPRRRCGPRLATLSLLAPACRADTDTLRG